MTGSANVDRIAPASRDATIQFATRVDDTAYVVTRNVEPPVLGIVDLARGQTLETYELIHGWASWPKGGAWHDGDLYLSLFGTTTVQRFETDTGRVTTPFELSNGDPPFALAADDEKLYVGERGGDIFEFDTSTGPDQLAAFDTRIQALSVAPETLYVSFGPMAGLRAVDRESGTAESLLPAELDDERIVKYAALAGTDLVVGTQPTAKIAVVDTETGASRVWRPDPEGKTVQCIAVDDRTAFFGIDAPRSHGRTVDVYTLELTTGDLRQVSRLPSGINPVRMTAGGRLFVAPKQSLSARPDGESLVSVDGDPPVEVLDQQAAGVPARPELPQSIGRFDGRPVVGGHAKVTIHAIDGSGTVETASLLGEPKAMTEVGDALYLAVYPSAYVARYRPSDGIEYLDRVGDEQNRPRAIHYHEASGLVLLGTHPMGGLLGGAVAAYDPDRGELATDRDVVEDHSIGAVTGIGDLAYLGTEIRDGDNYPDIDVAEARLIAWDPVARVQRWSMSVPDATLVRDLVATGGRLVGVTGDGELFACDPGARELSWGDRVGEGGGLVVSETGTFGATSDRIYRVDPETASAEVLAAGFDGDWFNWGMVAAVDGDLYTIEGKDLVRIEP